jgi:hypothetical protein
MLWGWRWQEGARPPAFRCLSSRQRQGPETGARDRGQRPGPETGARDRGQRQGPETGGCDCDKVLPPLAYGWGTGMGNDGGASPRCAGHGPGGGRHCHPCDAKQPRRALPCKRTPAAAPRWRRGCGQCDGSGVSNGWRRGDFEKFDHRHPILLPRRERLCSRIAWRWRRWSAPACWRTRVAAVLERATPGWRLAPRRNPPGVRDRPHGPFEVPSPCAAGRLCRVGRSNIVWAHQPTSASA